MKIQINIFYIEIILFIDRIYNINTIKNKKFIHLSETDTPVFFPNMNKKRYSKFTKGIINRAKPYPAAIIVEEIVSPLFQSAKSNEKAISITIPLKNATRDKNINQRISYFHLK